MSPKRLAATTIAAALALTPLGARATSDHCAPTRAANFADATGVADPDGDVRVFAIQFKHEIRHVETYGSFRTKMFCLVEELVVPHLHPSKPNIVLLNEDAGLGTIATGTRGAPARAWAAAGPKDPENLPGALGAFATLAATYQPAIAYYSMQEPDTSAQRLILAAATDTFVRGFMKTNSDIARAFGVYVVSSNNQAEFRETEDPIAMTALRDPDLRSVTSVYEAVDVDDIPESVGTGRSGIDVYNQAWMWAPNDPPLTHPVQQRYAAINGAPLSAGDPRRNIIHVTKKTPITSIEQQLLDLSDDRDMSAANTGPFDIPGAPGVKAGYGISLPSFKWGTELDMPFTGDPCASPNTWMRCLDARGMNLFLQPEANPGRWADYIDVGWNPPAFQSLSWLDSAWRAVADSSVANIRYAVTPHLVGNLVDLTFDGQSVILERCLPRAGGGDTCDGNTATNFVGAKTFLPCGYYPYRCDDPRLEPYAGAKREFIVTAPWVIDEADCPGPAPQMRECLAQRARAMEAGSGSPHENDYLETAVWADLDFDTP